jgi:hypothetical protein
MVFQLARSAGCTTTCLHCISEGRNGEGALFVGGSQPEADQPQADIVLACPDIYRDVFFEPCPDNDREKQIEQ